MGCNKDSNCLNIYSKVYPNAKDSIGSSISTIKGELNDIESKLNELFIPNDYLGSKVKEQLKEISINLQEDESSLDSLKKSINTFVDTQIKTHKGHYDNWKKQQDLLLKSKLDKENQTL